MSLWRRRHSPVDLVDLSRDSAFTMRLLDDTWRWRQRLVEELELGSGDHVRARSSYQLEFPVEFIEPFLAGRDAERVRVLLPLTTRDNRPLLNFGVVGPGGAPAHLLPRSSIASLQAEYLSRLVESSPAAPDVASGLPPPLLEGICVFTPAVAEAFDAVHGGQLSGLVAYLSDGLGFSVIERDVRRWSTQQEEAASVLASALQERPRPYSSSERVLLALPRMEPRPTSAEDIDEVVQRYVTAIRDLREANDEALLVALADYGRRWEVMLETVVALGEPSTVTLIEDRPLGLERGGWCTQRVVVGDARSFHLEARVSDHAVEIADFRVHDLKGEVLGIPRLEAARQTSESLALYSSEPDRPFYADVTLRLRPVTEVRLTAWLVLGLAWLTVVGAWFVPDSDNLVGRSAS